MHRVHMHVLAFWIGFACGTIGLFALALLRQLFPLTAVIVDFFLIPSRVFADLFTNGSVSGAMLIFLYILTGTFYGLSASFLEEGWIRMKRRK